LPQLMQVHRQANVRQAGSNHTQQHAIHAAKQNAPPTSLQQHMQHAMHGRQAGPEALA
jgi:hypothetical protein